MSGVENQSVALACQLKDHGWKVRLVSMDDQMIISHGYTRLRSGDTLTLVGSRKNLERVRGRFEK